MNTSKQSYSDFSDAQIHTEIHYKSVGLFQDPHDITFALSTDGAQLTMKKHSNTWILILILLNLPADIQYHYKLCHPRAKFFWWHQVISLSSL